jgi:hypothetical protein
MKRCVLVLSVIGLLVLCSGAEGGMKHDAGYYVQRGCTQNVKLKIKSGQVKKDDFDSELKKCMDNPNTYQ